MKWRYMLKQSLDEAFHGISLSIMPLFCSSIDIRRSAEDKQKGMTQRDIARKSARKREEEEEKA